MTDKMYHHVVFQAFLCLPKVAKLLLLEQLWVATYDLHRLVMHNLMFLRKYPLDVLSFMSCYKLMDEKKKG